jgi:RNA polymerase primary sigma factor
MENPNAQRAETHLEHDESLMQEIERSMSSLTERQREVICFFFGIGIDHPMTLEDIGEKFSLTRERVRQIKDKAITKMRTNSRSSELRSYMGV